MRQITLKDIRAAYKDTGLEPVRHQFGDATTCGCPVVALWKARTNLVPSRSTFFNDVIAWADKRFGKYYTAGFHTGVDGKDLSNHFKGRMQAAYRRGFKHGKAIAKAVFA